MDIENIKLFYISDGKVMEAEGKLGQTCDYGLSVEYEHVGIGRVMKCSIKPGGKIKVIKFTADLKIDMAGRRMGINGYQTWTECGEAGKEYRLRNLNPLLRPLINSYGDYSFYKFKSQKGVMHSYTYTYLRGGNITEFFGSIDEKHGYTIFESDFKKNIIRLSKELEGLVIDEKYDLLKLYMAEGDEDTIWDDYLSLYEIDGITVYKPGKCTGWTSWYNYYKGVTEEIIVQNLLNMKKENIPLDIFQIDDGYQVYVGDWLNINEKFPEGMKYLADKIKEAGYKPGLWLAPFICEKKSAIFREHKDWLLKDESGRLCLAGWNPGWSGKFYSLDIYNQDVRKYLKEVFDTIFDSWGYEMVKLDFLYAAGLLPLGGKTRAQVMHEAMEFLRELCRDKWILGCGVPLSPAFKKVEFCRIGGDVAPYWEDNKLKMLGYRERVSTIAALHNTLHRYMLNNRAFINDPDVFILRSENNKLNKEQRYTLFFINNLLGGLIFLSDNIAKYTHSEMGIFKSIFPKIEPEIKSVMEHEEVYTMSFKVKDREYYAVSNLNPYVAEVYLPHGKYYYKKGAIIDGESTIKLKAYETKCFLKIDTAELDREVCFIGSDGYIFPSSEIESIEMQGTDVIVKFKDGFINNNEIYFKVKDTIGCINVNGKKCNTENIGGYNMVRYS